MPDCVDAGMYGVEAAGRRPPPDRVGAQADGQKLPPAHHAVLPGSQLSDRHIPW